MNKLLLPLLVLAICIASCDKTPQYTPNRSDILRSGKWRIASASVMMRLPDGRDTTIDYYGLIPKCHQDDYLKFDSLNRGFVHNNGTSCSPADADSIAFIWRFKNDDNIMDIYNGFTLIDSVREDVYPYHIDTIDAHSNPIVLDTLATSPIIVLDSLFTLNFSVANTATLNIYDAAITNFGSTAFTMNFNYVAHYQHVDFFNQFVPVIKPDTFHYTVTYNKF